MINEEAYLVREIATEIWNMFCIFQLLKAAFCIGYMILPPTAGDKHTQRVVLGFFCVW